jgi:cysteine desulfurase
MENLPIYFDYMATTPVDPRVVEKMLEYMGPDSNFGNPASNTHAYGKIAMMAVDKARAQVASLINASPEEIIWTSGATESDNLAILGAARFHSRKGRHIITMKTEHKAVLDSCKQLEREGFDVSYLSPKANGLLDIEDLIQETREDTILVSVMHANNEIGVVQDITAIGAFLKDKGILFHVDAAQSAGKIPIDISQCNVDMMSFSGHKIYGPKGIGALYVKRKPRVRIEPLIFGGGHEGGMRSGTLATHQIVGMGEAFEIAQSEYQDEHLRLLTLRQKLWNGIKNITGVSINGDTEHRLAGNLNISFAGIDGESLLLALRELAISTSSACSSASIEPSYVLRALGLNDKLAHSSVRLSIGRFSTDADVDKAITIINKQASRMKEISPI